MALGLGAGAEWAIRAETAETEAGAPVARMVAQTAVWEEPLAPAATAVLTVVAAADVVRLVVAEAPEVSSTGRSGYSSRTCTWMPMSEGEPSTSRRSALQAEMEMSSVLHEALLLGGLEGIHHSLCKSETLNI